MIRIYTQDHVRRGHRKCQQAYQQAGVTSASSATGTPPDSDLSTSAVLSFLHTTLSLIYKRQTVTIHSVVASRSIYHLTPSGIVSSTSPAACQDGNELPSIPYWRTHLRLFYVQNALGHHSFNDFSREFSVSLSIGTHPPTASLSRLSTANTAERIFSTSCKNHSLSSQFHS